MRAASRSSLAVWIAAAGLWSLFLAFLGLHLVTPSDGARVPPGGSLSVEQGLLLQPLAPGGLQPGDRLLGVDGRDLAAVAQDLAARWPANPYFAFGQAVTYTVQRGGQPRDVLVTLGAYPLGAVLASNWGSITSAIVLQLAAAFVVLRRPAEPVARLLFLGAAAMVSATTWSLGLQVSDLVGRLGFWLYLLSSTAAYLVLWSAALHATLLFPTPWPPLARHRWIVAVLYGAPYAILALLTLLARAPNLVEWAQLITQSIGYMQGTYILLALAAVARSYRSARDPISRAQVRWVTTAFAIVLFCAFTFGVLPELVLGYPLLSWDALALVGLLVPLAFGVAILRYRLFDIDFLLNRTLVYGALTTLVVGVYVLIVGGLSALLQTRNPLAPALLTVLGAAFLFQPLRARLQFGVNRLMYGRTEGAAMAISSPDHGSAKLPIPVAGPTKATRSPGLVEQEPFTRQSSTAPGEAVNLEQARPNTWDFVFRGLAVVSLIEMALVALSVMTRPAAPGLIGQGLFVRIWLGLIIGPVILLFGGLIVWRVPGNSMGRLLILVALGVVAMQFYVDLGTPEASALAAEAIIIYTLAVVAPSLGYMMLTFPTGSVFPRRWRGAVVAAGIIKAGGVVLEFMASPGKVRIFTPTLNPLFVPALAPYRLAIAASIGIIGMLLPLIVLAGLISLVLRYRASAAPERRQIKWVTWGFGVLTLVAMTVLLSAFLYGVASAAFQVAVVVAAAGQVVFLSSLAIAVLRYRLFDIDILINRTLVYGSLTVIVVGVYVVAVGLLSELFHASGSFILSLLATGLIAVFFQPLRQRLQRFVNRLLYGERDDPYAVLSSLGRRLEDTLAPEAVLPALAETIAQTLKLPYVAVALRSSGDGEPQIAAAYGLSPAGAAAQPARLPLTYQAERVGELVIAPRGPGETFTPAEQRLLADIAHQAGVAAHAVRLTADLQRSRERLVTAREEERRRLRRDLHDGLGPALAIQSLKAGSVRSLLSRDLLMPDANESAKRDLASADALLAEMEHDIASTLADLRRLVYDLRPPTLDELGLVAAIRESAAHYMPAPANTANALHISVEAPEHLPPLPAAVEVAAFRITQEALTNVVHYAQARTCHIRLKVEGGLWVEIADDGVGLPAARDDRRSGVGLASMRERAAELGGTCVIESLPDAGTRVLARLPLR